MGVPIQRFVKNPESHAESAFPLCLILYFGLTTDDLNYATVFVQNENLQIVLRRRVVTSHFTTPGHPKRFLQNPEIKNHLKNSKTT